MKRYLYAALLTVAALAMVPGAQDRYLWSLDKGNRTQTESAGSSIPKSDQILKRLMEGNQHFTAGQCSAKDIGQVRRTELAKGQSPSAVVLSCSDSRVPPELFFDQGLGELFVVRVAGNITDPVTEESSIRDVYVAGDASRDVLLVAVAIAEGAKAGVAINRALLQDDGLG